MQNVPLHTKWKLSHDITRRVFLDLFNVSYLKSFGVIPNKFDKNPTVCVYLIILDNVVLLCIPHLLTDLPPPLGQLEVDKHVLRGEVVVSRQHPPGDDVPGGHGGPVTDAEDEAIPLPSTQRMTSSDIPFINPDTSFCFKQSLFEYNVAGLVQKIDAHHVQYTSVGSYSK